MFREDVESKHKVKVKSDDTITTVCNEISQLR